MQMRNVQRIAIIKFHGKCVLIHCNRARFQTSFVSLKSIDVVTRSVFNNPAVALRKCEISIRRDIEVTFTEQSRWIIRNFFVLLIFQIDRSFSRRKKKKGTSQRAEGHSVPSLRRSRI